MTSDQNKTIEAAVEKATRPTMLPVKDEARLTLNPVPRMGPRPTAHDIIAERGQTHGDFDDSATLSQQLKDVIRGFQKKDGTYPWHEFTPAMKDALDTICAKIGRVGAGRPDFRDHWMDIAGYATLVADRCSD